MRRRVVGWWGEAPDEPQVSFAPFRLAEACEPYLLVCPSRVHSLAEFRRGETEGLGEPGNVLDSRITQPPLNVADVGGIEAGFLGQSFLCELFRLALTADVQSQRGEDSIAFRHDS